MIQRAGMDAADRLRDEARTIAPDLGRDAEALLLDDLIGAMAGTREAPPTARARRQPYDPARLTLFERLRAALRREPVARCRSAVRDGSQAATLAFYDAYFSNFIEGTEFTVDEARDIVFQGRIPTDRPADAHDIAGVWRVVSDPSEMRRAPRDAGDFLAILRSRHATILQNRPDVRPGEFKLAPNRAGATVFVRPEEVTGTLERGFALYRSLETAFERAAFLLFLIGEVHPFSDGNGRLARIMMNAELVRGDEERIVIPTVFRGDYLAAMRALTHNGVTEPLIRMLDYAQRWTAAVDWRTVEWTARQLASCNAFLDSDLAEHEGLRLRLPHGV
ncbi:MAG: Fic family protein [Gammaproteobacteria bacterium]|nr:Fic family protein [Gammaproteobacteria bacterium]